MILLSQIANMVATVIKRNWIIISAVINKYMYLFDIFSIDLFIFIYLRHESSNVI